MLVTIITAGPCRLVEKRAFGIQGSHRTQLLISCAQGTSCADTGLRIVGIPLGSTWKGETPLSSLKWGAGLTDISFNLVYILKSFALERAC